MLDAFRGIPFEDHAKAEEALDALLDAAHPSAAELLAGVLARSPCPDMLLVRLTRYFDACMNRRSELAFIVSAPRYLDLLATLLGESHFLTDIICRNPAFMVWLWGEAALDQPSRREEQCVALLNQVKAFNVFDAQCQSMRRFKRREILRIATRDIFAHASVRSVTEDLSNLADATLEAALFCASQELQRRYGESSATFCVLAMGKLGGRELNFSSDIDLVFIYSQDGETSGGASGKTVNEVYFQKLGERLIRAISEQTSEGHVFRVDMRLRPYGNVAPLAVCLDSAVAYFETTGRAWERQALIKARPAAGDLALGEAFIERTRPFVYPRYFDDETLEDIRQVKAQLEAQIEQRGQTYTEVKLGRGGIRDIEFTVQMLQLLNGGRFPELRAINTLDAIGALGRHDLLRPLEAGALAANYTFMRRVEHRLQIEGSQQIHVLPNDPRELELFARRLGYESGESFMRDYQERAEASRAILERFLIAEGSGTRWIYDLLHPQHGGQAGLAKLAALGFAEPERAREELMQLYGGPAERPHSLHVRRQFTTVAPVLLEYAAKQSEPDMILMRLGQVLANIRATGGLYDLLNDSPQLCEYLVALAANSRYLTQILLHDPGLFETFEAPQALEMPSAREELDGLLAALSAAYESDAAIYRLHAGETLRIGMRELFCGADVFQVGRELTLLAEVCIEHALKQSRVRTEKRYGGMNGGFAVLGFGKLGGAELGYGSDLDLVFAYDAQAHAESGMASSEYFAAVASGVINVLKERTRHGVLYDVDARLRPDGKKGVLAASTERLVDYYTREAQSWERLALVKARPVAGDASFMEEARACIQRLAFERPFSPEDAANIAKIRDKIAAEASERDLKNQKGGLIEIEFATRLLQLRYGREAQEARCPAVRGALEALQRLGALPEEDVHVLLDAYTVFRRIENRIRMAEGASGSELPADPAARMDLARRVGIEGDLSELVRRHREGVRRIYRDVMDGFGIHL